MIFVHIMKKLIAPFILYSLIVPATVFMIFAIAAETRAGGSYEVKISPPPAFHSFEERKIDFFSLAIADYEAANSSEISAVKAAAASFCRGTDASALIRAGLFDAEIKGSIQKTDGAGLKVRIIGSRAVAYIQDYPVSWLLPSSKPAGFNAPIRPALYFIESNGEWLADMDYMVKLSEARTADLYQDAETFILAEQIWLLGQFKEFEDLTLVNNGDYIKGLSGLLSGAADARTQFEKKITQASDHFYLCLAEFKAGRYKHSYSHISACRALSGGNFIVETVFNMILTHRKFGRLIGEEFVDSYRKDPYNYLALLVIGEFYNIRFRYDQSLMAFELASKLSPFMTPHYHIVYSNTCEKLKNYTAAGDQLSICSSYGADFYYTRYLAGKKYIMGGDEKKAAREFEAVIGPLNFAETKREVAYWLMNYYHKNGDYKSYYLYRRAYIASFFNSPMFIFLLGIIWLFYVLRKAAARHIMIPVLKALANLMNKEMLYNKVFDAYCNFADCEAGIKYYSAYAKNIDKKIFPGAYQRCCLKLANYMLSVYRPEEAKKIYTELFSFRPDCIEALLGLAISEYDLKNYEVAIEYFKSGIELAPDNHLFYYYAGICTMLDGMKKEAIELIMISYKINSSFEPALSLCNNYFLANNMISELVSFYDDIFVLGDFSESYIQYYLKLNVSRMDSARIKKMLAMLRRMKIVRPETCLEAAVACRELDLFDEAAGYIYKSILISAGYKWLAGLKALKILERAAMFLPCYKNGRYLKIQLLELGITYKKSNDIKKAEYIFKKIIANFPDHAYAHFLLNNYNRSIELMAAELSESNYPWNNASIVEAIFYCLKETNNRRRLERYREWGVHYARSISNEFGIFSYRHLRYIPKTQFLNIINDNNAV